MGNVPAKEVRSRVNTYSSGSTSANSESTGSRSGRRNTTTGVLAHTTNDYKRSKKTEDKMRQKEQHYRDLVVRYAESVDGGFLAPFGTYKSNLEYNTGVVRGLILSRQLAPFYTPLQDSNDAWSEEELLILLSQLPLHSMETAYSDIEEEDDLDNHKIHKSANYYRRQEQKARIKALIDRTKEDQKIEEIRFQEEKLRVKSGEIAYSPNLPSRDLLLTLYSNVIECPICFLYYPPYLNISRCCLQPICTECFVQIKRLDPHPPHDDRSNEPGSDALPHTLISESASCPYCAMSDFGVTYDSQKHIRTGIHGIKPGLYKSPFRGFSEEHEDAITNSPEKSKTEHLLIPTSKPMRRSSLAADSQGVITVDTIRPDWEQKLILARNKLARKAATATAIHASNLLIYDENEQDGSENRSSPTNTDRRLNSGPAEHLRTVEERMIEEALRLSILDEEERRKKVVTGADKS